MRRARLLSLGTRHAIQNAVKTTLAISLWGDQVSTTFDFASKLLVVETDGGREVSRKVVALVDEPVDRRARRIRDMAVQVVLCGTISQPLARAVSQAGIEIIPYVAGQVDNVLAAYLCGQLAQPRFLQPGCRPGARRRWRYHGGGCGRRGRWQ